jgi:hypothetical protein
LVALTGWALKNAARDAALLLEELDLRRGRVQLVADEGGAGKRTPVEKQEALPRIGALEVALRVES